VELKEELLQSHTLETYQNFERLTAVPSLNGQKPPMLLEAMLEFCPSGEEKSKTIRLPVPAEAAQKAADSSSLARGYVQPKVLGGQG
jgi:hypothetical protein